MDELEEMNVYMKMIFTPQFLDILRVIHNKRNTKDDHILGEIEDLFNNRKLNLNELLETFAFLTVDAFMRNTGPMMKVTKNSESFKRS